MKKLSGEKYMEVYTSYIGRYVTKIFAYGLGDIHQNDGTELDFEGKLKLLQLKSQGYILEED